MGRGWWGSLNFGVDLYHGRSPWSNKYAPALEDGFLPTESLRAMELDANLLYDAYREQYYEVSIYS